MEPETINLASLAVGILAAALAIFFFVKGRRIKRLAYEVRAREIISDLKSKVPHLDINFHKKPIMNFWVTKIAIWNSGNVPIKSSDIAEKSQIRVPILSEGEILHFEVVNFNSEENRIGLRKDSIRNFKNLEIKFEFLDPGDGAVVQIFHTGKNISDKSFQVLGKIIGGRKLARASMKKEKIEKFAVVNLLIGFGLGVGMLLNWALSYFFEISSLFSEHFWEVFSEGYVAIFTFFLLLGFISMVTTNYFEKPVPKPFKDIYDKF